MNMTVGMKMDHNIKNNDLNMYNYGDVYFPDPNYFNCDPFPIEWLELFQDRETFMHIEDEGSLCNQKIGITPLH